MYRYIAYLFSFWKISSILSKDLKMNASKLRIQISLTFEYWSYYNHELCLDLDTKVFQNFVACKTCVQKWVIILCWWIWRKLTSCVQDLSLILKKIYIYFWLFFKVFCHRFFSCNIGSTCKGLSFCFWSYTKIHYRFT